MTSKEARSQGKLELLAFAAWRLTTGLEPTEPLHAKGGALDPDGWTYQAAEAIVSGEPMPRWAKDVSGEPWRERIMAEHRREESGV